MFVFSSLSLLEGGVTKLRRQFTNSCVHVYLLTIRISSLLPGYVGAYLLNSNSHTTIKTMCRLLNSCPEKEPTPQTLITFYSGRTLPYTPGVSSDYTVYIFYITGI